MRRSRQMTPPTFVTHRPKHLADLTSMSRSRSEKDEFAGAERPGELLVLGPIDDAQRKMDTKFSHGAAVPVDISNRESTDLGCSTH